MSGRPAPPAPRLLAVALAAVLAAAPALAQSIAGGSRVGSVMTAAGPDGYVYVLTDQDDGDVWRLRPLE